MSALAKTMPFYGVSGPCEEANLPVAKKVLVDKHAEELKEALACYKHARAGRPMSLAERFGKNFMDKVEGEPTVIGEYKF